MPKRTVIVTASWIIAFIVALTLDSAIASSVHDSGLYTRVDGKWWAEFVLKVPGQFWFTVAVAVLLWLFRRAGWKCSVFVVLAGVISGINVPIKWIVGRSRPFKLPGTQALRPFELHPFWHGIHGFFSQRDLCFPSGHACTAFALATAIYIVWRPGALIFICLAVLVGLERISENAHYLSDVVGAAAIAVFCVTLLNQGLGGWMRLPRKQGFLIKVSPLPVESGTLRP